MCFVLVAIISKCLPMLFEESLNRSLISIGINVYVSEHRTGHPGYPALQLLLTCDEIRTKSELLNVKYSTKGKKRMENNWNHVNLHYQWQATSTELFDIIHVW